VPVPVPDVTGLTAQEARTILLAAGLGLALETGTEWADSLEQRIAAQNPLAGTRIARGATVFVTPVAPEGFPWVTVGAGVLLTLIAYGLVKYFRRNGKRRNGRSKPRIDVRVKEGASFNSAIQAPQEPVEVEVRLRMRSPRTEPRVRFPTGSPGIEPRLTTTSRSTESDSLEGGER
jgi:hypothetical protein